MSKIRIDESVKELNEASVRAYIHDNHDVHIRAQASLLDSEHIDFYARDGSGDRRILELQAEGDHFVLRLTA